MGGTLAIWKQAPPTREACPQSRRAPDHAKAARRMKTAVQLARYWGAMYENLEIIRRGYQHFDRTGEFDPELVHPDAELDNSNAMLDADVYKGSEGLREYLSLLREMWKQVRVEPQEFIPLGEDRVLVPIRMTTVGRNEIETSANAATLFTLHGGKVTRIKNFQSKADALKDLGPQD